MLQQAEEQLQVVMDAIPAAISWITADLKYLGFNRYLAELLDLQPQNSVCQEVGYLRTSPDLVDFARDFFASPALEASREIDSRVGNATRRFLVVARKYHDGQAAVFAGIDISERRRAEAEVRQLNADLERRVIERTSQLAAANQQLNREVAERRQAEAALKASEARYRAIVEDQTELICRITPDGVLTFANDACGRYFGQRPVDLIGRSLFQLMRAEARAALRAHMSVLTPANPVGTHEYQVIPSNDEMRWQQWTLRAIVDPEGRIGEHQLVGRDITERKRAEAQMEKALQDERQLNDLKSRFTAMVSHEFRTPLAIISSSAQLLEAYAETLPLAKTRAHAQHIRVAVKDMTRLLDDVLVVSKGDAGKFEPRPDWLELRQFCLELCQEWQVIDGAQHVIIFDGPEQPVDAFMDAKLLRQILCVLLSNALKYSPEGSTVRFDLACRDGQASLSIADQGIGILAEDQERLFEAFYRGRNVANVSGTGLGLAIAKRAVDAHGGTISVTSRPGEGTTFTVCLPLCSRPETLQAQITCSTR